MKIFKKLVRWFDTHSKMGAAIRILWKLEKGDSSASIEQVIALLSEARREFAELNSEPGFAAATLNLAKAFTFLPNENREENLRQAIVLLEELSTRLIKTENANLQLSVYEKLGELYFQLFKAADSPDSLHRSIEYLQRILKITSPVHKRHLWKDTMLRLAILFFHLDRYDKSYEALNQAISLLEKLLSNLILWERWKLSGIIHYLLGNAYFFLFEGNIGENRESAIYHLYKAVDSSFFSDEPLVRAEIYITLAKAQPMRARGYFEFKRELIETYLAKAQELYNAAGNGQGAAELSEVKASVLTEFMMGIRPTISLKDIEIMFASAKPSDETHLKNTELEKLKEKQIHLEKESLFYLTQILEKMFEIMKAAPADKCSEYFSEVIDFNFANINQEIKSAAPDLFKALEKRCDDLERSAQSILKLLNKEEVPIEWAKAHLSLAGNNITRSRFLNAESGDGFHQKQSFYHFKQALSVFLKLDSSLFLGFISRISGFPILFVNKHWKETEELFGAALKAQEQVYQISFSENGRENALREAGDPLFGLASAQAYALARLGKTVEAVETLEKWRGRKVGEFLQRDSRNIETVNPEILKEYYEVVEKINILEVHQRNRQGWDLAEIFAELKPTRERLAAIIKRIRSTNPDFMLEPTFSDIQRAASKNKPLAYILTTEVGSLVLLVFDKGEPAALWEDNFTKGKLFALLAGTNLENSMEESIVENPGRLSSVILPNCAKLPEKLFNELELQKAEGVVLIPCGTLALLPIHAITVDERGCLLDHFDIHYAPSAYTMFTAKERLAKRPEVSPCFVGIGDPDQSLENAALEVEWIDSSFENLGESHSFIHEKATLENLQDHIRGATYLHFACHGKFGMTNTLDSALTLARNEKLTLRRILDDRHFKSLKDARLVVLSACQTSLIEVSTNPDESIGITLGFLSAGVSGVVGTLWSVPDISTALLMVMFYRKHILEKTEPARALRIAQSWLREATLARIEETFREFSGFSAVFREFKLREAGYASEELTHDNNRPFADPYYWAGFILVGT
jgi:CHAT domain-containing protein/tetratricopeptide (TPR) repeat protein